MAGKQISALDAQVPEKTDVLAQQDSAGVDTAKKSTIAEILALIDASDVPAHANTHAQGGSDAVSLDASQLATGTLADARLPAEVPLTDETNTFTAIQTFNSVVCADITVDGTEIDPTGHTEGQILMSDGTDFLPIDVPSILSNTIINPTFSIVQRQSNPATLTTYTDGSYSADRWCLLTQDVNGQFRRVTGDTQRYAGQLKKTASGTTRIGCIQWVEGINCYHLRGQTVTVQMRVKCSESSKVIRCGIVESTKTEDSITRDAIDDWTTSPVDLIADYNFSGTPGSVISDTNWQVLNYTTTLGSSFNNLAVLIWSETGLAQNATLDIEAVKLSLSNYLTLSIPRSIKDELNICKWYYEVIRSNGGNPFASGASASSTASRFALIYSEKRIAATVSISAASDFQVYLPGVATVNATAFTVESAAGKYSIRCKFDYSATGSAGLAVLLLDDNINMATVFIDAEL